MASTEPRSATHAIVNIQIIPKAESLDGVYPAVDRAIEVIARSGVPYEVSALGTTMEGDLDDLFEIVKEMHRVVLDAGCESVLGQIRTFLGPPSTTIAEVTKKYR
jgi:uncharacterized protein (TIGR00106 family)